MSPGLDVTEVVLNGASQKGKYMELIPVDSSFCIDLARARAAHHRTTFFDNDPSALPV